MRVIYAAGFAVALLFSQACSTHTGIDRKNDRPNILFIAVDDLRPELGAYGEKQILSPSMDRLASEGLVFDRAYCNVPVCGASRASLLSGVRPGMYRYISAHTRQQVDFPGVLSLPKLFKKHGYTTVSNGKIYHHQDDDLDAWNEVWRPAPTNASDWRDYQTRDNLELDRDHTNKGRPVESAEIADQGYFDGKIADKSISDLRQLKDQDKPFFLAVGFLKPHLPFNAPKKYWDLYDREAISLPENYMQPSTTPEQAYHNFGELRGYHGVPKEGPVSEALAKELIHGYYACVSYTDAQIGRLLNALDELELAKDTIVIVWGDHGWNLGDHMMWCKHCNFESSLHAPLILKVPGKTTGQHTAAITEYIDIYPSLCELAGLPLPPHLDGESFVPLLEGQSMKKNYAVSKYGGGVTLIQDELFYTEFISEDGTLTARMLFDHAEDPLEMNNLAESKEYKETITELSQTLRSSWGDDFFVDRRIKQQ